MKFIFLENYKWKHQKMEQLTNTGKKAQKKYQMLPQMLVQI